MNVVAGLCAAERYAKARHNLIENQQRAMMASHTPQPLQIAGFWQHEPHIANDWFEDHRRNFAGMLRKQQFNRFQIVKRQRECLLRCACWHAGAIRQSKRSNAGASLHQQHVAVTVIMSGKLDDLVASSERPCQSQCAHCGFCAAVDKANHLNRRHQLDDEFSQFSFQPCRSAKTRPASGLLTDRFDNYLWRVAQNQWSPAQHIVDIAVAVHVPNIRSAGMIDEQWIAPYAAKSANGRIYAAGNNFLSGGVKFF